MIVFQYDGDIISYLTAVYDAISMNRDDVLFEIIGDNYQLRLDAEYTEVQANSTKCDTLIGELKKHLGYRNISDIYYAFESADKQKDTIIFNYIRLAYKYGKKVTTMLSHPHVILFNDITHKVHNEIHRMSGFLRFVKTKSDIYYAAYSPENNITTFLVKEFITRFPIMSFVLHDVMRGIIGIYNGNDYIIMHDKSHATIEYAEDEMFIQNLWKKYYASVNIEERYNKKQMMSYMPRKYIDNIYTWHDFD